jgi:NTP pyrophosphatase (non-canonical NTP hydrolase)
MNIDDIDEIPEHLSIDDIFQRQHELSEKYRVIEGRPETLNLDTREGQQWVKDFLWRITEEVGEALDSALGLPHIKEELADAFHFLIELCLLTSTQITVAYLIANHRWHRGDSIYFRDLVVDLAKVGRTCKNKPWKQTQIPIDQGELRKNMENLAMSFLDYCCSYFESKEELYQYYFKKSKVNDFRIESKY